MQASSNFHVEMMTDDGFTYKMEHPEDYELCDVDADNFQGTTTYPDASLSFPLPDANETQMGCVLQEGTELYQQFLECVQFVKPEQDQSLLNAEHCMKPDTTTTTTTSPTSPTTTTATSFHPVVHALHSQQHYQPYPYYQQPCPLPVPPTLLQFSQQQQLHDMPYYFSVPTFPHNPMPVFVKPQLQPITMNNNNNKILLNATNEVEKADDDKENTSKLMNASDSQQQGQDMDKTNNNNNVACASPDNDDVVDHCDEEEQEQEDDDQSDGNWDFAISEVLKGKRGQTDNQTVWSREQGIIHPTEDCATSNTSSPSRMLRSSSNSPLTSPASINSDFRFNSTLPSMNYDLNISSSSSSTPWTMQKFELSLVSQLVKWYGKSRDRIEYLIDMRKNNGGRRRKDFNISPPMRRTVREISTILREFARNAKSPHCKRITSAKTKYGVDYWHPVCSAMHIVVCIECTNQFSKVVTTQYVETDLGQLNFLRYVFDMNLHLRAVKGDSTTYWDRADLAALGDEENCFKSEKQFLGKRKNGHNSTASCPPTPQSQCSSVVPSTPRSHWISFYPKRRQITSTSSTTTTTTTTETTPIETKVVDAAGNNDNEKAVIIDVHDDENSKPQQQLQIQEELHSLLSTTSLIPSSYSPLVPIAPPEENENNQQQQQQQEEQRQNVVNDEKLCKKTTTTPRRNILAAELPTRSRGKCAVTKANLGKSSHLKQTSILMWFCA